MEEVASPAFSPNEKKSWESVRQRDPVKTGLRTLRERRRSVREDAPLRFGEGFPMRRPGIDFRHRRIRMPEREKRIDRGILLKDE